VDFVAYKEKKRDNRDKENGVKTRG
jgi:hypothetical protein